FECSPAGRGFNPAHSPRQLRPRLSIRGRISFLHPIGSLQQKPASYTLFIFPFFAPNIVAQFVTMCKSTATITVTLIEERPQVLHLCCHSLLRNGLTEQSRRYHGHRKKRQAAWAVYAGLGFLACDDTPDAQHDQCSNNCREPSG